MPEQDQSAKRLRDLLPGAQYFPHACDPFAQRVSDDPESVVRGSLYVHLDECDSKGAERAASLGAAAVIAERLLPDIGAPQAVVDDAREAKRLLETALPTKPLSPETRTPPLVAVGGSVGRTTVAGLSAAIFAEAGATTGVYGTLGCDDGECFTPHSRSTPATTRWRRWLQRCRLGDVSAVIATATPGRPTPMSCGQDRAQILCLTSLRGDRLDSRGRVRWESVAQHRSAIEGALGTIDPSATLIVGCDDADSLALASKHPGRVLTFGQTKQADLVATPLEQYPGGQELLVRSGRHTAGLALPRTGAAYRNHCVAAIAVALAAGVDLHTAVRGVESATPPLGLAEPVVCGQAYPAYLDRAVRPLALRAAMAAALPNGGGRTVIALRLSDDPGVAHEQLSAAEAMADRVIASGHSALGPSKKVTVVPDRETAVTLAVGLTDEGDALLVAGCLRASRDRALVESLIRRRMRCERAHSAA